MRVRIAANSNITGIAHSIQSPPNLKPPSEGSAHRPVASRTRCGHRLAHFQLGALPLIGHMKEEGHLGRCYLKGYAGDAANAILTAAAYNFRRIPVWLSILLRLILADMFTAFALQKHPNPAS